MKNIVFLVCCFFGIAPMPAQTVAIFEVSLDRETSGLNVPVKVNLEAVTFLPDSALSLVEVKGGKRTPVAFQIDQGVSREIYWVIDTKNNTARKRIFEL